VNVVRAAHAELVVTDLDRAADFYGGLLGFVETERDAEALYYRGYEEREHHSLVLRRGARPAVSHIAFRIARPDDLAVLEERFRDKGLAVRRIPAGEERGQGAAVRVQDPCGLPVELYHEMETVGRRLQQYHLHRGHPSCAWTISTARCPMSHLLRTGTCPSWASG
jgi:catechol 2,3-dioxygenase-like lactoylglutathione lyase family enzyme